MIIGVPKEIKVHEYRVGLTPFCVRRYVQNGHQVLMQKHAGMGSGFTDAMYKKEGAQIIPEASEVFERSEMIIKVKEPQASEVPMFKKGQILFTYLHLACDRTLLDQLMNTGITAYAYETIRAEDGSLPCLLPMSEIAGRVSTQQAAKYLEREFGGKGVLLGGVPGVRRGKVVVLGGGIVGFNAALMAVGLGADVTIMDISKQRMNWLSEHFGTSIHTLYSNEGNIEEAIKNADAIIGAALIPGRKAPILINESQLSLMEPGTVLVDVAVDQGGCFETTKATTHAEPIFVKNDVVHYCVSNMPGAVPQTSTLALTQETLSYGLKLACKSIDEVLETETGLSRGLSLHQGELTCPDVAATFDMSYRKMYG